MNKKEKLIKQFYKKLNNKIYNLSINDIAESLNIIILETYGQSRIIQDEFEDYIIILNKDLHSCQKRKIFFHELAHYFLKHLDTYDTLTNYDYKYMEKEADSIGLLLAIPPHELKNFDLNDSDIIIKLYDLYNLPLQSIEERLQIY
ncbi:ImmA/IrrE family metallo-endopeptidase [Turicibacter bilis]|uniref:ImmA/IrrE family metallo-endopeptidase n=1 Tax=Turicibacter bilis TaxID=2735723 RepID=UPI001BB01DC7|nr:ImmA/IrrE family metallo-endopeptidase [Turicibacter bilis]MBS3199015.1 ImmA/IrrE family metallo-endopeptidase [Turicibacter bilis]